MDSVSAECGGRWVPCLLMFDSLSGDGRMGRDMSSVSACHGTYN